MYFGSVRFFKNLIFLSVCILILIPSVLAFRFYRQSRELIERVAEAQYIPDNAPQLGSPDSVFEPDAAPSAQADPAAPAEQEPGDAPSDGGQDGNAGTSLEAPPSADHPAYEDLYPDFYAPQPYRASQRVENTIYLTFDDGPSDRTDEILAILAEKNVKATFFVTGQSDEKNLQRMRRIVEEGHTIGMHSYSHVYSAVYASVEGFLDEFYKNFVQIREATGVTPTVFRCPGGSINGYDGAFYQEMLSEMIRRGFVPFDWNISSEDAVSAHVTPAEQLTANVVRGAEGKVRGFVLFHDSERKTTTPAALGPAIARLREMGFEFAACTPDTLPVLYSYEY